MCHPPLPTCNFQIAIRNSNGLSEKYAEPAKDRSDSSPARPPADVYVEGFAGGGGCDKNYWLQAVEEEEIVVGERDKDKDLGKRKVTKKVISPLAPVSLATIAGLLPFLPPPIGFPPYVLRCRIASPKVSPSGVFGLLS